MIQNLIDTKEYCKLLDKHPLRLFKTKDLTSKAYLGDWCLTGTGTFLKHGYFSYLLGFR